MKRNWYDIKVLILGFSKSGISAARYLASKGAKCFITEKKAMKEADKALVEELAQNDILCEFEQHSEEFIADSHIAITSPGIPPHSELISKVKEHNIQIISEVELAYRPEFSRKKLGLKPVAFPLLCYNVRTQHRQRSTDHIAYHAG